MTYEEYELKLKGLYLILEEDKKKLIRIYANANNPYSIGDFITDHQYTIKIEKITFTLSFYGRPYCIYYGLIYNKNGKPRAKGKSGHIHQINIIKK